MEHEGSGERSHAGLWAGFQGAHRWLLIASVGPLGFSPRMPGTLTSAVVVLVYASVGSQLPWVFHVIGWLVVTAVGWRAARICEQRVRTHDPSFIVVDEWSGQWLALIGLPGEWPWLLASFFIFRFLDIVKPLGLRRLERLPGGSGVMLDDIAAGAIAFVILHTYRIV